MTIAAQAIKWPKRDSISKIGNSEIHVWKARTDDLKIAYAQFHRSLSLDEQKRAQRYKFEKDRKEYGIARGLLRRLIGDYLHCPPSSLSFNYSEYGKPSLARKNESINLDFNVSHSNDLILIAFSKNLEVGIDIEFKRANIGYRDLAKHCFSEGEQASLRIAETSKRKERFYCGWTRKEAVIKAQGKGLSLPLDSFTVSTDLVDHLSPLALVATEESLESLSVYHLDVEDSDYAAALAFNDQSKSVNCFQFAIQ